MSTDKSHDALPGRRRFLAAGLALASAPAFGLSKGPAPPDSASREFDAFVLEQMRQARIPGLAVGLARDGATRFARGFGYADIDSRRMVDVDTVFHLASITKTVTATAIAWLHEQGRLDLDEPVARHLDFPLHHPRHRGAAITARQLLMHTSGISDANYYRIDFRRPGRDADLSLHTFLRDYLVPGGEAYSVEGCFSASAPGAAWGYSNVGYAVLGELAARVSGEDMRELTRRELFAPLGMTSTFWTLADTPAARSATPYLTTDNAYLRLSPIGSPDWPGSMLRSSIADLTRYVAAAANGGATADARMLRTQSMAELLLMRQPAQLPAWLSGQGLGWMQARLGDRTLANHWGGDPGVFTAAYLDPNTRCGVAILCNVTATDASKAAIKNITLRLLSRPDEMY
ncbi:CubicO group peptidase, beta-lactamase class C family [Lysobacter sp. yr284]|uniref:serine hydrolase domain-containing protein n=1 Tax=Lysobacter sp. yr284 TaxID=1761791 RepID=UPI00089867F6|nr:serine hydrolase domain-containing protein [Lysobacter sp. yr284]SDZ20609.1 CubicO group peptidase, beta-lactamase class C family [Lysobacter sp. yr284]